MADDYGDSINDAGMIAVGGFVLGDLEQYADWDWFQVTLVAGHTYRFDLEGTDSGAGTVADPYLTLWNKSGAEITYDDDSGAGRNARISFTATASGYFYLSAEDYGYQTGTYRLSVADITPDTIAPRLIATSHDNQTGVSLTPALQLTFSEQIAAGSGNIYIRRANGSIAATIPVADAGQIAIAGTTMTITPAVPLAEGTAYYVTMGAGVVTDLAGNAFAGISAATTLNFTTGDFTAPVLVKSLPADDGIGVAAAANIVLTYNEAVKAGGGSIRLYDAANDALVWSAPATRTTQVAFSGTNVTLNPPANLTPGHSYYVEVDADAILDKGGNAYAGITGNTALSFTVLDGVAPRLIGKSPADNATSVPVGSDIVLTFDEAVIAGRGFFDIRASGGALVERFSASSPRVSFAGSTVAIDPTNDLAEGTGYYVTVSADAILDATGTKYAGFTANTALNFVTEDTHAPLLVRSSPADDAIGVAATANIVLTFNEVVKAGAGSIVIRDAADDSIFRTIDVEDARQAIFAGSVLTINPSVNLVPGHSYSVTIDAGAVLDRFGLAYAGLDAGSALAFTVSDGVAPKLVGRSPSPGATGIAVGADIVLIFNEAVVAGVGYFDIRTAAGVLVERIASNGPQVSYSGSSVTIDPSNDLAEGTAYYVTVSAGAISDATGAMYAGFTSKTTLSFTTEDTHAPLLLTTSPADDATGVAANANLVLTFNETVKAVAGHNVSVYLADGTLFRSMSVTNTAQVAVAGNKVTINPPADLDRAGQEYYVTIDPGAFADRFGNAYAGLTDTSAFTFTTRDLLAPTLTQATPADNSVGVAPASNLVLQFSEAVQAGSGNILIYKSNGTLAASIAVTDTAKVSFAGNVVTIDPPGDLAGKTGYYVRMAAGVIKDMAGNSYAGLTTNTALNFTTADTSAPVLVATTPADNATAVAANANIVLTFDETVAAGAGNLVIHNATDGSAVQTIAVTDSQQVTFAGNKVTVNPASDLSLQASYYVTIDPGAILDTSGNAFAGISGDTELNFNTKAGDDYFATTGTSGVVAVGGSATGNIETARDRDWFKVHLDAGTTYEITEVSIGRTGGVQDPYIYGIYNSAGQAIPGTSNDDIVLGVERDSLVTYTPTQSGDYFISAGAFDTYTGAYEVAVSVQGSAPVDSTSPTLASTSPADNAASVDARANMTLTFSEAVQAGTGNIVLHSTAGDRTIAVTDAQVTINGASLTINPSSDLALDADYYVTLGAGAVTDLAGNPFAGISDPAAFNFHTAAASASVDAWTIFVYIAADNNLEEFGIADINEMEQANLPANVNVVVLFDRIGGYDSTNGNWTNTRVGAITHDTSLTTISSVLTSWGELNTGRGATLTDFLDWGVDKYAADNYGLVVWDHGGGLDGIAWDDTSNDNLTLSEMRGAIQASAVGHFGFIGFDACLMGMTEEVFDLRYDADVIIGSEELIPGNGWAYDRFLGSLAADPAMTALELGSAIVTSYGQEYAHTSDITLSATDTSKLGALDAALDSFVDIALHDGSVTSADWTVMRTAAQQSYLFPSDDASYRYHDLGDFMSRIVAGSSNAALDTAAGAVITALSAAVFAEAGTVSAATGLSIYLPSGSQAVRSDYTEANFSFLGQVAWDDYLARL